MANGDIILANTDRDTLASTASTEGAESDATRPRVESQHIFVCVSLSVERENIPQPSNPAKQNK